MPRSGSGIRPPRRGSSYCRCDPMALKAGAKNNSWNSSPATAWSAPASPNRRATTARPRRERDDPMSNTIHDMGGMHGFGPVEAEPNEPPFHEKWEGRVFALQRAMGYTGLWTIDAGRASMETLPPITYLSASY